MNGNATAECDWLFPSGFHSETSDVSRERRLPVGRPAHPSEEKGGSLRVFFCLGTGAEWGPAGYAAAVGLHPRVWRLGLHRRARETRRHTRDGEKENKGTQVL
ncbi:hypothetical protein NQZ68_004248 [Dissostichus eleginoides]|nr:hypothetical protein NQZ68_004248 [Dissostichus eleginoides]